MIKAGTILEGKNVFTERYKAGNAGFVRNALLWESTRKFSREFMKILLDKGIISEDKEGDWKEFSKEDQDSMIKFLDPYIEKFAKFRSDKQWKEFEKYLSGFDDIKNIKEYEVMLAKTKQSIPLQGRDFVFTDLDFHRRVNFANFDWLLPSNSGCQPHY